MKASTTRFLNNLGTALVIVLAIAAVGFVIAHAL